MQQCFPLSHTAGGLMLLAAGLGVPDRAPADLIATPPPGWHEMEEEGPPALGSPAMVWDPVRERVLLVGRDLDEWTLETWELDGSDWEKMEPENSPSGRADHAMVFDHVRETVLLFGGREQNGNHPDSLWEWDGEDWSLIDGGAAPPGRSSHAMASDSARNRVLVFGGTGNDEKIFSGGTWEWDGTQWHEINAAAPGERFSHAMAFDTVRGEVVMYGGFDGQRLDDTWTWDGSEWSELDTTGPPERSDHAMVWDAERGRIVLFGGQGGGTTRSDTWEWDGSAWEEIDKTGPSGRVRHGMAWDGTHGRTVLFGGTLLSPLDDAWVYFGEEVPDIPPDARARGDFDNDGCTGFQDFTFLLENWGVEFDGEPLGFPDFTALLEHWGEGC